MSRMEKINQQIRREICEILQQEMADPRLEFVSITQVQVSKDLRNAKVFFSALGNHAQGEQARQCLEKARGLIRKNLGKRISIRYLPELSFYLDKSLEYSAQIDETIKELKGESKENSTGDREE